jgi:hypothetical protein
MPDRSALDVISQKARKHIEPHLAPDENVLIVLVGGSNQSLVALDNRLMIVKPGFMAGATLGAKVTSFPYRDISALEVNTHMLTAVVEVIAPGYDGRQPTSYWSRDKNQDPFKLSNCVPTNKKGVQLWQPYLEKIRAKIAEAKHPPAIAQPQSAPTQDGLVAELERLQSLKQSGALTDAEFEQAKARLLQG